MRYETSPIRSKALRNAAKGQSCKLQIPGICLGGTDTTVLAHLPSSPHGLSLKGDDLIAVEACAACHDVIDGRSAYSWDPGEKEAAYYEALTRQLHSWVVRGLVNVEDMR